MKFKKYPKIGKFENVVYELNQHISYDGKDGMGNPIYSGKPMPTVTFNGTVKLHGTNASIVYNPTTDEILAGKRTSFITVQNDNAGFASFVKTNEEYFRDIMSMYFEETNYKKEDFVLYFYGEWAGQGIQKGVAISNLSKAFYLFDIAVYNEKEDRIIWLNHYMVFSNKQVFDINTFTQYTIDIDFEYPKLSLEMLNKFTDEVEQECPVSSKLGVNGIGEGIVWKAFHNNIRYVFKVKGDKHSKGSGAKKKAQVDPDTIKSIVEFAKTTVTEDRVMQAIEVTGAKEKKDVPDILRWVANDIIDEEFLLLQTNNLEWKQVAREVSNEARKIYFQYIEDLLMKKHKL